MSIRKYDFVIVGSGAGGATLARELSKRGKQVLVAERGQPQPDVGTFRAARRDYDGSKMLPRPFRSKEGVIIYRTLMAGGTTVVACGNSVRALEKELAGLGIVLRDEFAEAEKDSRTAPLADGLLSDGSRRILSAARELGYTMRPMPKVIDPVKCTKCGRCVFGCPNGAKWTAIEYLDEARRSGAEILYNTSIERVMIENGVATGVAGKGPGGRVEIRAHAVILSAGGLATPVILLRSGIETAGQNLFIDPFVNVYGLAEDVNLLHEPTMTLLNDEFHESEGFIMAPFINPLRIIRFVEAGLRGFALPGRRLLGMMVKVTDEASGSVGPGGTVSKVITQKDRVRLDAGAHAAAEILVKAGVRKRSLVVSRPQGAHPGGTAAIGKVVDTNLRTSVAGLFVCDASVLPQSPGAPPILTIVALAKRLAKSLAAETGH